MKPPTPGPERRAAIPALVLAIASLVSVGCSGGSGSTDGGTLPAFDAGPTGCMVQFSGNYTDSQTPDGGCGGLVMADGGAGDGGVDWQLVLQAYSPASQVSTQVQIDLGPQPSPGTFNADNVATWSAVGYNPLSLCEFSAGSLSVPTGTFTLTLDSISGLDGGSASITAHGALEVEQFVQQPVGSDCGADDTETLTFEF